MRHAYWALVLTLVLTSALALAQLGAGASALAQPSGKPTQPSGKPAGPSFQAVDANRDGRLSLAEVLAYAKKAGAEVEPFRISDVDLDGDGRLSAEEQRKAGIKGLEQFGTVDLKAMDIHGDGYVSKDDLDEYFRRQHREAYAKADADGDDALKPSEFVLLHF